MTELRPSRTQPPTWLALSRLDSSKVLLTSPGPQSGLKMYPPGDTWEGPMSDSSCCHKPWGHSGMPVGQGDLVSLSTKNKALAVTGHQGDWMQKSEPQRHAGKTMFTFAPHFLPCQLWRTVPHWHWQTQLARITMKEITQRLCSQVYLELQIINRVIPCIPANHNILPQKYAWYEGGTVTVISLSCQLKDIEDTAKQDSVKPL